MLLGVLTFAKAQKGSISPQEEAALTTMSLTKSLKLTKEQQSKVKAIYLERGIAMRKIKVGSSKAESAAALKKINAINDGSEAKVYALLNDSQKKVANKMKADREKIMSHSKL